MNHSLLNYKWKWKPDFVLAQGELELDWLVLKMGKWKPQNSKDLFIEKGFIVRILLCILKEEHFIVKFNDIINCQGEMTEEFKKPA
jgi:hypothetical protein